jgi:flagellar biosynthetic protein FliR
MDWLAALSISHLYLFALVLARVGGMAIVAPLYSSVSVPWQIRTILAVALAALIMPVQLGTAHRSATAPAEYLLALTIELLLGFVLGLGVAILLAAAELAGQMVAQASGLALAEVLDPEHDSSLPVMAKLLALFTLAIYLLVGGHRWLMAGLLGTFAAIPPGSGHFHEGLFDSLLVLMGESFSLALSAAAPALVAVLLATLILGMISRTLPQLNILSVGFGLNTLVALAALAVTFGSVAWLFENELHPAISLVLRAITAAAPADTHT